MAAFWQKSKAIGLSFLSKIIGTRNAFVWQKSKSIGLPFFSKIFGTRNSCFLAKR